MRVRSHSMDTMVGSQKHNRSSAGGGGLPTSLSGAGLTHSNAEFNKNSVSIKFQSYTRGHLKILNILDVFDENYDSLWF